MCGLGKGLAKTGRMILASVDRALAALHRFKALSWQARTSTPCMRWRPPPRERRKTAPISFTGPR